MRYAPDGAAYTYEDFEAWYGVRASQMWEGAPAATLVYGTRYGADASQIWERAEPASPDEDNRTGGHWDGVHSPHFIGASQPNEVSSGQEESALVNATETQVAFSGSNDTHSGSQLTEADVTAYDLLQARDNGQTILDTSIEGACLQAFFNRGHTLEAERLEARADFQSRLKNIGTDRHRLGGARNQSSLQL